MLKHECKIISFNCQIKTLLKLFLVLTIVSAGCFDISAGVPLIQNFDRKTFGSGAQNWAVACDSLGRLYFGNRRGLLTYNSNTWDLKMLPNFSTVRSVLIDPDTGRVYVGGSEEFGYFDTSSPFLPQTYVSLTGTIAAPGTRVTEVWNIHHLGNKFWFQSDYTILEYDGKRSTPISSPGKITASALIDNNLIAAVQGHGLYNLANGHLSLISGGEKLSDRRVVDILDDPASSALLIVTEFDGLFRLTPDGSLTPAMAEVSEFLKKNQAFCAHRHESTGQIAFGTVSGGVVLIKPDSPTPIYIGHLQGLQDNTVLNLGFDIWGNLWLALDNGITYVASNSAISELPVSSQPIGAGYSSLLRGNTLYLGTNRGLYSVNYPVDAALPKSLDPLLKGQIWGIDTIGSQIFVGGDGGLWSGNGNGFTKIEGINGTWAVRPVPGRRDKALAATYNGFFIIDLSNRAAPRVENRVDGMDDNVGRFWIDINGNIWMGHWIRGIYRLRLNPDLQNFSHVDLFTGKNGLPTNNNNVVSIINGHPIFSTEGGYYAFDPTHNRFEPDSLLNIDFANQPSARTYQSPDGALWSVSPDNVWVRRPGGHGRESVDTTTYQSLASRIIAGFDHINFISPRKAIVASQDGFFEVSTGSRQNDDSPVKLFISQVIASPDSIVYTAGINPGDEPLTVGYSLNSLIFEMVMPEYREINSVRYSFLLEGYDDSWTPWSRTPTKEYTRLAEGTYTLRGRAMNLQSGQIGETELNFTILPPWYRTTVAKIIYLLMLIALGWFAWRVFRRSSDHKARMIASAKEQELADLKRRSDEETLRKNVEIAHLKSEQLEHDIKHKSEELSNITMNVIRKNEILLDIASKLAKVQDSIASGDPAANERQIAKIQRLIQDNISHDDDWKGFTKNFDIVYENYTRHLTERHPELNAGDLRICCYLKMGLSSKEIAPLINISYRSVEMTRYRLRKKMGLSRDINLTEYLQKI